MMEPSGANLIAGRPSKEGDATFRTLDPLNGNETPWTFTGATQAELDRAVAAATAVAGTFRDSSGASRAQLLRAIADEIEALGDALTRTYCLETALPKGRAEGERARTLFQLRGFAELLDSGEWMEATLDLGNPDRKPVPAPDLRKLQVALGPIAVFGASNFPLAYSTAGGDTASALAAGCPVVVKAHPMHSGTSDLVAAAVDRAVGFSGFPKGIFSHLHAPGIELGGALVDHPGIKGVGFTGSIRGGRALFDRAARRPIPIPVFAEMGSVNPVVLLPEVLATAADEWALRYADSVHLGAGQFCTNPGILIGMAASGWDQFGAKLADALASRDPICMLHPAIREGYEHNRNQTLDHPGVEALGRHPGEGDNRAGQAVGRTDSATFLKNPMLGEEVFGPFTLLVTCPDSEAVRDVIDALQGQLTGTVIGTEAELPRYGSIVEHLRDRVGRLVFNGVPTGVEVTAAMQHGGPYPASTDSRFTAVGVQAVRRWTRPVAYQNAPDSLLPDALKDANPLGIQRLVDGVASRSAVRRLAKG